MKRRAVEGVACLERNPLMARILLFCCRYRIPILGRVVRIILHCDIYCAIPSGLLIPHPYGIVIHSQSKIGCDVVIFHQVTLGQKNLAVGENVMAPIIGDRVKIGAGARILGAIVIGDDAIIGANAVVTKDVPAGATVVGHNRILLIRPPKCTQIDGPNIAQNNAFGHLEVPRATHYLTVSSVTQPLTTEFRGIRSRLVLGWVIVRKLRTSMLSSRG